MFYTSLNENKKIIFNENKEGPVKCPECGSIDTTKQGIAYVCPYCKTKFMPNDDKKD